MKKMNKQELIEYFISLLGDNSILGSVISINEIREKLESLIEGVTYDEEKSERAANNCFNGITGKSIINFDLDKIHVELENEVIVHELLHVLSEGTTSYEREDGKTIYEMRMGLQRSTGIIGDNYIEYNRAINEGMTDYLAERITGVKNPGYQVEKNTYKLLRAIIREEDLLRIYLRSAPNTNINIALKKAAIARYGKDIGEEIGDDIIKILALSDNMLNIDIQMMTTEKDETKLDLYKKMFEETQKTFMNIFNKVIDNEPDIVKKLRIMKQCMSTSLRKPVAENALNALIDSNKYTINEKIVFFRVTKDLDNTLIQNETIERLLLESYDSDRMTADEKLKVYVQMHQGEWTWEEHDRIYNRCYGISEPKETMQDDGKMDKKGDTVGEDDGR